MPARKHKDKEGNALQYIPREIITNAQKADSNHAMSLPAHRQLRLASSTYPLRPFGNNNMMHGHADVARKLRGPAEASALSTLPEVGDI